jgi:copper(I)-binding protein
MIVTTAAPRQRRRALGLGSVLAAAALLLGACGEDGEPAGAATPSASPTAVAQPLAVKDMWVKTAASGMTAAFGTLLNTGSTEVTVVKATSTASPVMELHEVATVDGEMKPGGDHLMKMDIKTPVTAGTEVTFTLTFADGKTMEFTAIGKDFAGGNESYQPGTHG